MRIFDSEAWLRPQIIQCVAALKDDHIGLMIEAFGRSAGARIPEIAKLISAFHSVIEVTNFAGIGFETESSSVDVARAWLRKLRAGFGADGLWGSIACEQI